MRHCTLNNDQNKDKKAEYMGFSVVAGKQTSYKEKDSTVVQ